MQVVWYIVLLIASSLISASLAKKPEPPKPEDFEDFDFPQADEGTPQAVIFGECWTGDWMVAAYGNYRTQEVRKESPGK
jgi:hypothetical protein